MQPDAPLTSAEHDAFHRIDFARQIYQLAASAPAEWSVRIGVYGRWGEGKTTVLRLIEQLARADGYRVAWLNPWSAIKREELWTELSRIIAEATDSRSRGDTLRGWARWGFSRGKVAAQAHPVTKALAEIFGADLLRWIEENRQSVEARLSEALGNGKLVIMIDDLDRGEVQLVPQLLLALREVFDLRQCVFILALDPIVVAHGFPSVHPGWGATPEFLEKILQFKYWVPSPTRADLLAFAKAEVDELRIALNDEVLGQIVDLLPRNPRKVRQFLRSLWRLKPVIDRHSDADLDTELFITGELLRWLAPRAAEMLLASSAFHEAVAKSSIRRGFKKDTDPYKDVDAQIRSTLENVKPPESTRPEELLDVVRTMTERRPWGVSAENVRYWTTLSVQPPLLTWTELRHMLRDLPPGLTWNAVLDDLVTRVSAERAVPAGVVELELFEALLEYRRDKLSSAADADLETDLVELVRDAALAREMLQALLLHRARFGDGGEPFGTEQFLALYEHIGRWAHWGNVPAYDNERLAESRLLAAVAERAGAIAPGVLNAFTVSHKFRGPHGEGADAKNALLNAITDIFTEHVQQDLKRRFVEEGGLKDLRGRDRHPGYKSLWSIFDLRFIAGPGSRHSASLQEKRCPTLPRRGTSLSLCGYSAPVSTANWLP